MVQATFQVSSADFNDEIIDKIKSYIKGQHALVTISIVSEPSVSPKTESKKEYFDTLDKSIGELEDKESLVSFTMEEFKAYSKKS